MDPLTTTSSKKQLRSWPQSLTKEYRLWGCCCVRVAHCPCILCFHGNSSGCGSWVPQHLATCHFACANLFFLKLPGTEGRAPGLRSELRCERKSFLLANPIKGETTENSKGSCKLNLPNWTPSKIPDVQSWLRRCVCQELQSKWKIQQKQNRVDCYLPTWSLRDLSETMPPSPKI